MSESGRKDSALLRRNPFQNRSRALVKTALYRVLMVLVTVVVAYLLTGEVGTAINIGLVTNLVKTLAYYSYERLWAHVSWGVAS